MIFWLLFLPPPPDQTLVCTTRVIVNLHTDQAVKRSAGFKSRKGPDEDVSGGFPTGFIFILLILCIVPLPMIQIVRSMDKFNALSLPFLFPWIRFFSFPHLLKQITDIDHLSASFSVAPPAPLFFSLHCRSSLSQVHRNGLRTNRKNHVSEMACTRCDLVLLEILKARRLAQANLSI